MRTGLKASNENGGKEFQTAGQEKEMEGLPNFFKNDTRRTTQRDRLGWHGINTRDTGWGKAVKTGAAKCDDGGINVSSDCHPLELEDEGVARSAFRSRTTTIRGILF